MNFYSGTKDLGDNPEPVLNAELITALAFALEMGVFVDGATEIDKLAKRYGLLRATVEGKFIDAVTRARGRTEFEIVITREEVEAVAKYIGEHWGDELPPYKKPFTPGTQPIKPDEISVAMAGYIEKRLREALQRQLLEVL